MRRGTQPIYGTYFLYAVVSAAIPVTMLDPITGAVLITLTFFSDAITAREWIDIAYAPRISPNVRVQ